MGLCLLDFGCFVIGVCVLGFDLIWCLIWKGEIFGGIEIGGEENDGEVLMRLLGECGGSVPNVVSRIKGPWALIYWQVTFEW